MKLRLAFALMLLWSNVSLAVTHQTWVVSLKGTGSAYRCTECALRTPKPDAQSLKILNEWREARLPFDGPDMKGASYKIGAGDKVILCSQLGCSTYIWEESSGWGCGTFQPKELHGNKNSS